MDPSPNAEVEYESLLLPFLKYKDGRVERLDGEDFTPPSENDPATGVSSKDALIQPDTGVSARIYLPKLSDPKAKLPVLVYYHGGGFCIETPFSPLYHPYVTALVSQANVVAVSVHYRRATEHLLPIAYDDSWAALKWVASHAEGNGPEKWLNDHADFGHVFLAGDSAGANITYNVAMRAGQEALDSRVEVDGIVLVHPYFWGKDRLALDEGVDPFVLADMDRVWPLVCPTSERGNDDPWINPCIEGAPSLAGLGCRRVLVCVAGKDALRGRGLQYYEKLGGSGWGGAVELLESEGEGHVFHLFNPASENAVKKMERLVSFFHGV